MGSLQPFLTFKAVLVLKIGFFLNKNIFNDLSGFLTYINEVCMYCEQLST